MYLSKKFATFVLVLLCLPLFAMVQDGAQTQSEDIEAARLEVQKTWGVDGIVKLSDVDLLAKEVLSRPLSGQTEKELKDLASQANMASNFISIIVDEYQDYYRSNYQYDFVQEKVAPFHDEYVNISNRLKNYRNQSYFNLGKKAVERGSDVEAFFLFRDAFRLSTFTESEGDHKGLRYQSEIEMKRLIGLESTGTFIYWK